MKTACVAALATVGAASAFVAPTAFTGSVVASVKCSSAMKMSFENAEGAQPPIGFWDPLELLKNADQERFDRLRYVELKHGRISMLAILGHLVAQNCRFPGGLGTGDNVIPFADIPNGLAAFSKIPPAGTLQIILFIGLLETTFMKQVPGSTVGDMQNFPGTEPNWAAYTPEQQLRKRMIELNNGRAAQMGILALMVHEKLGGHPYIINDLLGAPYTWN